MSRHTSIARPRRAAAGHRRPAVIAGAAALVLAVSLVLAGDAAGQQEPSLDRVDALVSEGRTEEARRTLERWWREVGVSGRSRVEEQRSLWLRALLTLDPDQAAVDYQRLVVEYPGGAFSDEALLRLAQGAYARGDLPRAAERYRALLQDYPESPGRLDAREWLARYGEAAATLAEMGVLRAEPERPRADPVRRAVDEAPGRTPAEEAPDPTAGEGLDRSAVEEAPVGPPVEDDALRSADPPATDAPAAGGAHGVQVGAFAGPDRARSLARRLADAGFDPRIVQVPSNRLLRVRVGRFASLSDARDLARRLAEAGFPAYPVSDVADESDPSR